jgi:hypothetical protein
MNEKRERLAFRPSGPVRVAIDRLNVLTGRPRSEIVSEMLDAVAPMFVEQIELMQKIATTPEKAREYVRDMGVHGINVISQQLLDLPPVRPKRGRPRKNAAP